MKSPLAGIATLLAIAVLSSSAHAQGVGRGAITIVATGAHAYGYSVFPDSACWVDAPLSGDVVGLTVGDYLGAVVTTTRAYAFNGVSNRWFSSPYAGTYLGSDARGAIVVFWTDCAAYGIATIWASWRGIDLLPGESPLGGGSTGDYAIVWTTQRALAFNPGSGQWTCYELEEPVLDGLVLDEIALIWTQHEAVAFDSGLNTWIPTTLTDATGASADEQGGGDVAILWGAHEAHVFVDSADGWFALIDPQDTIQGGSASGQVGIVWSDIRAHVFDAPRQRWTEVALDGQGSSAVDAPDASAERFSVCPNPARAGSPSFRLAQSDVPWNIEVIDAAGRRIRSFVVPASSTRRLLAWNAIPGGLEPLSRGTYWVRARSGGRVEARRVVVLD